MVVRSAVDAILLAEAPKLGDVEAPLVDTPRAAGAVLLPTVRWNRYTSAQNFHKGTLRDGLAAVPESHQARERRRAGGG